MNPQAQNEAANIYQRLPEDARRTVYNQTKTATSSQLPTEEGSDFILNFVKKRTIGDMDEIATGLKKHFPLKVVKPDPPARKVRNRKKVLTSTEKRKLGIHKLPKTGLQFKSFAPLHKLWVEYMESYLDLDNSTTGANQDQLHQRLAKADYHGCLLIVKRSRCPSYIGMSGLVIMETKNTFQIICEDDKLRILPKRDSIFNFIIRKWTFTLFGNHFNIRPSERASRKFKSRPTIDL